MMKFSWGLLILCVLSGGCLKSNKCPYKEVTVAVPLSEQQQIEAYLSANSLTASKHASGFYYQVVTQGSGATPGLCSTISVGYTGKLASGAVFDTRSNISFELGATIEGWKKGIPLVQKGGRVRLYVPPSLGYGPYDVKDGNTVVIPANSMLIFDVELFDVN